MGNVVNTILNTLAILVSSVLIGTLVLIALVQTAFGGSFEEHMKQQLEFIFSLFGLNGEDIINTSVSDVRLLDDQHLGLMTEIALIHQDTQMGIIDIMKQQTMGIMGRFNRYFDYGKNTYVDGLPDSNLQATVFPRTAVIDYINTAYGVTCELSYTSTRTPTKEEYVYASLYDLYQYNASQNKMNYLGDIYSIDYIDYNYLTNEYDIAIYIEELVTTDITTEITITITNIDATTDNKHTYTKVTTTVTSSITGVSSSFTETNTDEVIPIGSAVDSYSNDTVYGTPVVNHLSPTIISLPAFGPYAYLIAIWHEIGFTDSYYWVYKLGSGVPALDARQKVSNLDMLPIIEIRHDLVNINSDPTSTKYLQSKEILSIVGGDIDALVDAVNSNPDIANITDAFVYFGLDLSDTSPTVAKMVYKVFEYILETASDNPPGEEIGTMNQYRITVTEGVYNSALAWSNQTLTIKTGIIGPVGTYQSQVSGANLFLRYQATPTQYREYCIYEIFTISILARGGLQAAVTKTLLAGPCIMPLSYNLVNQFSPLEQMEIFAKSLRLSTYSAEVIHLEFYETKEFGIALQIVSFAIIVILAILSGGTALAIAGKILVGLAVSYAIKEILESSLPAWLKILLVIVAVAIGAYGTASIDQGALLTADQVTSAVTNYVDNLLTSASEISADTVMTGAGFVMKAVDYRINDMSQKLQLSQDVWRSDFQERMEEVQQKQESLADYVSTEFVSKLTKLEDIKPTVQTFSVDHYKAIKMQSDHVNLCVSLVYDNIYNYDTYFKTELVSIEA